MRTINDRTPKIYLSRRNLETLLSKLTRDEQGKGTTCSIIKFKNPDVPAYQQTMKEVMVIAVQDEDYYTAMDREPSVVHPDDEPRT